MVTDKTPESQLQELLQRLQSLRLLRMPKDVELSPPMIALLAWVSQSPGCGVLELADELNVTPPTVSIGVRRLVRDGWLVQRRDPNDRRAKPLFLTKKSEALVAQFRSHQSKVLGLFLSGLSRPEQEQFLVLFEKAVGTMEETLRENS
jgi:DNA-binding MarR family transcriptional regulator